MGESGAQVVPDRIAHYQVMEQLGAGGMGVVYRAMDTKLGRAVALKFLPEQFNADPSRKARLLQEARAAAALDHVNVGTIHAIEEMENGRIFIVMAYYEGQPLSEVLKTRRLGTSEVVRLARQIAQGLAAAHRQGIIHRDIKPSNVIVTPDGLAKIVDFGLARSSGSEHLTETGAAVGTASYMSPEQVRGEAVDPRTDIWSLGVVLYQMVTGAMPFRAESMHSVLYQIVNEPPAPVPAAAALAPILQKALAKDLSARYADAGEMIADLDKVDAGQTVNAPTMTMVTATAKGRRPRRWLLAAPAVMLALVAAGALVSPWRDRAVSWFSRPGGPPAKHIVVLPFRNIGNDPANAALCDGLTEVITSRLTGLEQSVPSLWVIPASEVRRKKVTNEGDAKAQFGAALAISGSVQRSGGGVQLDLNLVDAESLRLVASRMVRSPVGDLAAVEDEAIKDIGELLAVHVGPGGSATAGSVAPAAYEAYLRAQGLLRRSDKPENVDEAIRNLNRAIDQDPRFALAYSGLAEADWSKWTTTKDSHWLDAVSADAKKALSLDAQIAPAHISLAQAYEASKNPELAIHELQQALQLNPRNVDALRGLGRIWEGVGRVRDAETEFQQAIALHPEYWQGHNDYALFLARQARFREAEREYQRVLELAPDNVRAYSNLGSLLVTLGRLDEARRLFEKSIALSPSYFALANLGTVLLREEHVAESARAYEQALRLNDKDYRVWAYLAAVYERIADPRARATLERAAAMAENALRSEPESPVLLAELSYYYAKLGRRSDSLDLARKATLVAPSDTKILSRTALAFEVAGAREDALRNVTAALEHGGSAATFTADPEMKGLVADRRFAEIAEAAKKSAAPK